MLEDNRRQLENVIGQIPDLRLSVRNSFPERIERRRRVGAGHKTRARTRAGVRVQGIKLTAELRQRSRKLQGMQKLVVLEAKEEEKEQGKCENRSEAGRSEREERRAGGRHGNGRALINLLSKPTSSSHFSNSTVLQYLPGGSAFF